MIASPGYPALIWTAVKAALSYAQANLDPNNTAASATIATATAASLRNGVEAINVYQFYAALQTSYANLSAIQALAVTVDTTTESYFSKYLSALEVAAAPTSPGCGALLVVPTLNSNVLLQGTPMVPYPGSIEWRMNASFPYAPAGLTASNFGTLAQGFATAWQTLIQDLMTQDVSCTGLILNELSYTSLAASATAFEVSQMTISPSANLQAAWTGLVILPTMARVAAMYSGDPTSRSAQQAGVWRYVALSTLQAFNTLIVNFSTDATPSQVRLVPVRAGDTLMDIAARELGDYSQWSALAAANNLLPPYVSTAPGPNVAVVGQLLFLPNATTSTQVALPSYLSFFLGTDILYGPIGADMSTWTGDLQVTSGYANLALSLGRRLQTTLGTLRYHSIYGSRLPPEVGAITTGGSLAQIQAYATSALLSDERVAAVNSVSVTATGVGLITVIADVTPNGAGYGQQPIQISSTIG